MSLVTRVIGGDDPVTYATTDLTPTTPPRVTIRTPANDAPAAPEIVMAATGDPRTFTFAVPAELVAPGDYPLVIVVDYPGNPGVVDTRHTLRLTQAGSDVGEHEGLAITPEELADEAGFALTDANRAKVLAAIEGAQADVEAHCGQPIPARTFEERVPLDGRGGWATSIEPRRVVSTVDHDDGTWTVTFVAGRDDDRAVRAARRYVKAAALAELRDKGVVSRQVRSVSVEGQAVSYESATSGTVGVAGGPVTIRSLDRFKRVGVFSRPRTRGVR